MTPNLLATVESTSQTDLNRAIARVSIGKSRDIIGSTDFRNAANVMGKTLTKETDQMLSAVNATKTTDLPANVLEWLQLLGEAICA